MRPRKRTQQSQVMRESLYPLRVSWVRYSHGAKMLRQSFSGFDRLIVFRRPIYILARTLAVIFVGIFILEHGDWSRTQEFRGPFERSPGQILQYHVAIGTDIPFLSIPSPRPPSERSPGENSPVRIWVNGTSWNPPEAQEPLIDQGRFLGIRGLYRTLQFALPSGVANDASTILKVEYQIRAQRTPYEIIAISAMTMILLALCLAYRLGDCKWISAFCTRATAPSMWVMHISSWLLVGRLRRIYWDDRVWVCDQRSFAYRNRVSLDSRRKFRHRSCAVYSARSDCFRSVRCRVRVACMA